jgi:DinB superfamily
VQAVARPAELAVKPMGAEVVRCCCSARCTPANHCTRAPMPSPTIPYFASCQFRSVTVRSMNETVQALTETPGKLEDITARLEANGKLDTPREEGKWTPRQILAHLADVESIQTIRVLAMLSEDSPRMVGFHADAWAVAGAYATRDAQNSLRTFSAVRNHNLELWGALTAAQLERRGVHPIRGEFSIAQWLGFVSRHDANHVAQLEASLG